MPIGAIAVSGDIQINDQFDDSPFGNAATIVHLPGGGFMVFWSEATPNDTSGGCVQGRVFDADGVPVSPQFVANTSITGNQGVPSATLLANGNVMVAWTDSGQNPGDTTGGGVRAQVFASNGQPVGSEFLVNTTTIGTQNFPNSVALANGNVMILWQDVSLLGGDASGFSVKGQIVDAAGAKIGGEFLVNTQTLNNQNFPHATVLTNGNVVVTWQDASGTLGDTSASVKAQILDATGAKVGGEFLVNTQTTGTQNAMSVTALANGNFIVTWQDASGTLGDTSGTSIKAQIFDAAGAKIGAEFLVNTVTDQGQANPTVTELSDGSIVIAWRDNGPAGTVPFQLIRAQVLNPDGTHRGDEFIASEPGENFIVGQPAVEDLGDGQFVITATRSILQGGTQISQGLHGQIFTVLNTIAGTADADILNGTTGADSIDGLDGADVINGLGGIDVIDAGDGDDQVDGGEGNDVIIGDFGHDTLLGGNGNDLIFGDDGNDSINGGAGDDEIHGGTEDDQIDGGSGNNQIFGDDGNDTIVSTGGTAGVFGGNGDDIITASGFILNGEDGNDTITATGGVVFMQGGLGDDTLTNLFGFLGGNLYGEQGNDILRIENASGNFAIGGDGDDDITVIGVGGFGYNTVFGDAGNDVIRISGSSDIWLGTGVNRVVILAAGGTITINDFNGGEAGDVIDLSIFGPNPFAPGGRLTLTGTGGDGAAAIVDSVTGMRIMLVGVSAPNLSSYNLGVTNPAFAPVDMAIQGTFADFPSLDWQDELVGADGNDTIRGFGGADLLFGGGGNDLLFGGEGGDTMFGGTGNDTLIGESGANFMFGESGDDRIVVFNTDSGSSVDGGSGTDTLQVAGPVTLASLASIEAVELQAGAALLTLSGNQFSSGLAYNTMLSGTGSIVVNMTAGTYFFASAMTAASGSSVTFTVNGSTDTDVIKAALGVTNTLNGGDGADQIRGGNLADIIDGGNGNDKITGLGGAEQLTGGAGADQFRYLFATDSGVGAGNRDVILDFVSSSDRIDFRGLDANLALPGRQTLSFTGTAAFNANGAGEVRYEVSGGDLLVQVDLDGNGTADMEMLLQGAGAHTLSGTDFLF